MAEYIEREALLRKIRWASTPEECVMSVRKMPAADVEPVMHGVWRHYPDCGCTRCSVCGWSIEECFYGRFCPYCGAKMGDVNDG